MKRLVLLAVVLFVVAGITPASAQWRTDGKITVPFEFTAGSTVLPAGNYTVLTDPLTHMVQLWNTRTGASAYVQENDILQIPYGALSSTVTETKLIFRRDGDRHVLHQIRLVGDDHTHDLVHGANILELAHAPN